MTADEDSHVRYQLAFSLGSYVSEGRNRALAELSVNDGENSWMRLAVFSSLNQGSGWRF